MYFFLTGQVQGSSRSPRRTRTRTVYGTVRGDSLARAGRFRYISQNLITVQFEYFTLFC
jgi:hypothetical protein